jgi:hypothetical protein
MLVGVMGSVCRAADNDSLMVGQWNCSVSSSQPLYVLTLETHDHFLSSHQYTTQGMLTATLHGQPIEVQYAVTGKGIWQLQSKKLSIQLKQLEVENVTNPEWEAMLNLQQHIPKKVGGTLDVAKMSADHLQLKAKKLPEFIECDRK